MNLTAIASKLYTLPACFIIGGLVTVFALGSMDDLDLMDKNIHSIKFDVFVPRSWVYIASHCFWFILIMLSI